MGPLGYVPGGATFVLTPSLRHRLPEVAVRPRTPPSAADDRSAGPGWETAPHHPRPPARTARRLPPTAHGRGLRGTNLLRHHVARPEAGPSSSRESTISSKDDVSGMLQVLSRIPNASARPCGQRAWLIGAAHAAACVGRTQRDAHFLLSFQPRPRQSRPLTGQLPVRWQQERGSRGCWAPTSGEDSTWRAEQDITMVRTQASQPPRSRHVDHARVGEAPTRCST